MPEPNISSNAEITRLRLAEAIPGDSYCDCSLCRTLMGRTAIEDLNDSEVRAGIATARREETRAFFRAELERRASIQGANIFSTTWAVDPHINLSNTISATPLLDDLLRNTPDPTPLRQRTNESDADFEAREVRYTNFDMLIAQGHLECRDCSDVLPPDLMLRVVDADNQVTCPHCSRRHYVHSAAMRGLIRRWNAVQAYDSGDYATTEYADANWFNSDYDGTAFESDEARDDYDRDRRSEDEPEEPEYTIYSYHQTTPMKVHGGWPKETPRSSLCFGVELEMEHKSENSSSAQESMADALGGPTGANLNPGRYILMSDGSLNESGVELITMPYTLDFHQSKFDWKKTLAGAAEIGRSGKGTRSCGMHVHVNRDALTSLQVGKMLVFINSDSNKTLVNYVAQRSESTFARKCIKKITDGRGTSDSRYEALNVGQRTVEFRIFRGNLRFDRVLKNIEFCAAVANYCRDASIREVEEYTGFLKFVRKNRGTYPNLFKYLENRASFKSETFVQEEI